MNKEGWTYKKFEDIMSPAKVERCGGRTDLPILSITMHNGIVGQNDRFKKVIASRDKSNYKIVKNGQLVIAFPIDEGLIYTQDVAPIGIMSPAYNIWNVDYSQVDRHFIVSYFHSQYAFSYYKAKLRATTQRRRTMDKSDLLSMPIPVPPLSVQQRIVSELDQLSDIIAMKRKQVEEYDALTQSLFYEMFGDPIINDKGWNVSKLSNVVSFKNGLNFKQSDLGETFKFIGVGDFGEKKFIDCEYLENYVHINETIPSEYFLQDNDIVIVRSNGSKNLVGRGMLVKTGKTRTLYSGFCIRCRISDPNALSPTFLITFLMNRSIKFILRNEGRGANISNINQKMLSNLPIPLPPLSLQHAFAAKVRAIEHQKQLVNDSIREVQTLLDSRMQEYFG